MTTPKSSPTTTSITDTEQSTPKPTPTSIPYKQIRALHDKETITVYQAYSASIAEEAVAKQKLNASSKFRVDSRMTWIKPSWGWMLYRSGYSYKDPGQERILALRIRHGDFISLLRRAVLTSLAAGSGTGIPVPSTSSSGLGSVADEGEGEGLGLHAEVVKGIEGDGNQAMEIGKDKRKWRRGKRGKTVEEKPKSDSVKVQWDPERNVRLERLDYRSIQIGIPGCLTKQWCEEMIVGIEDVTEKARELKSVLDSDEKISLGELVELGLVPVERVFEVPLDIRQALGMEMPGGEVGEVES